MCKYLQVQESNPFRFQPITFQVIVAEDHSHHSSYILFNYGEFNFTSASNDDFMIGLRLDLSNGDNITFEHPCSFSDMQSISEFGVWIGNTGTKDMFIKGAFFKL